MSDADGFINVTVERRYDEGSLYTKEEFEEYYGTEWKAAWDKAERETTVENNAAPAEVEAEPGFVEVERRHDTDGDLYTKEDFEAFYGGTDEWDQAPREKKSGASSSSKKPSATAAPFIPSWGLQSVGVVAPKDDKAATGASSGSWGIGAVAASEPAKGFGGFNVAPPAKPTETISFGSLPVPEKEKEKEKEEPKAVPAPAAATVPAPATAVGTSNLWRCTKCGTEKEFTGDHLKNKKTIKASCNSKYCAYKSKMWERIDPSAKKEEGDKVSTPKKDEKDVKADTPAANPFSAGGGNPFAKKDDDKKDAPAANPFSAGGSNPFGKKDDEKKGTPVANPFSAGGSNPFAKKDDDKKDTPAANPFGSGANPFSTAGSNPFAKKDESPAANPFSAGSSNPFSKKDEKPAPAFGTPAATNPFSASSNPFAKNGDDKKEVPVTNPFSAGSSNPFSKKDEKAAPAFGTPAATNPFSASSNPFAKNGDDKKEAPVANPFSSGGSTPFSAGGSNPFAKKDDTKVTPAANPFSAGTNPFSSSNDNLAPSKSAGNSVPKANSNPFGVITSHPSIVKEEDDDYEDEEEEEYEELEGEYEEEEGEEYEEQEEEEEETEPTSAAAQNPFTNPFAPKKAEGTEAGNKVVFGGFKVGGAPIFSKITTTFSESSKPEPLPDFGAFAGPPATANPPAAVEKDEDGPAAIPTEVEEANESNSWKCTNCGSIKTLSGDHLKAKKEIRSQCNSKKCCFKKKTFVKATASEVPKGPKEPPKPPTPEQEVKSAVGSSSGDGSSGQMSFANILKSSTLASSIPPTGLGFAAADEKEEIKATATAPAGSILCISPPTLPKDWKYTSKAQKYLTPEMCGVKKAAAKKIEKPADPLAFDTDRPGEWQCGNCKATKIFEKTDHLVGKKSVRSTCFECGKSGPINWVFDEKKKKLESVKGPFVFDSSPPASGGFTLDMGTGSTGTDSASGGFFDQKPNTTTASTGGFFDQKPNTTTSTGGGFFDQKPATAPATGGFFDQKPNTASTSGGFFEQKPNTTTTASTGGFLDQKPNAASTGGGFFNQKPASTETETKSEVKKDWEPPKVGTVECKEGVAGSWVCATCKNDKTMKVPSRLYGKKSITSECKTCSKSRNFVWTPSEGQPAQTSDTKPNTTPAVNPFFAGGSNPFAKKDDEKKDTPDATSAGGFNQKQPAAAPATGFFDHNKKADALEKKVEMQAAEIAELKQQLAAHDVRSAKQAEAIESLTTQLAEVVKSIGAKAPPAPFNFGASPAPTAGIFSFETQPKAAASPSGPFQFSQPETPEPLHGKITSYATEIQQLKQKLSVIGTLGDELTEAMLSNSLSPVHPERT